MTRFTGNADAAEPDVFLGPGELACLNGPGVLKTILGSCVAVCLFDTVRLTGGMCHFILPDASAAAVGSMPAFSFGDAAIREILARLVTDGSNPRNVTAKILGGGHVTGAIEACIGQRNIAVARKELARHGIAVTGESVGGFAGRRVRFETGTGRTHFRLVEEARAPRETVILIGSSTGGTEALACVLEGLRRPLPPVVIVQHIPPGFTRSLAENLGRRTDLHVSEARNGEPIENDHVYIAPGGRHLQLRELEGRVILRLTNDAPVHSCKPSVDVAFFSATRISSRRFVAAILTGMGSDGAQALRLLHGLGALTFAQDEASCVVFGMPKAAIEAGGVDHVVSLGSMAGALTRAVQGKVKKTS